MAAYREKMSCVLVPADNMPDLYEVDNAVKDALQFIPVRELSQALAVNLLPLGAGDKKRTAALTAEPPAEKQPERHNAAPTQ